MRNYSYSNNLNDAFIIPIASLNCGSVIIRGGAKRIIWLCVGLAISPFSFIARQISHASFPFFGLTTIALRSYDLLDQHIQLVDKEIKLLEMSIRLHGTEIIAQVDSVPVKSSTGRRKGDQNMSRARELLQTIVDPNEPIYCFCRQVAFGNMVACDNEECAIEWFHCSCVNLTKMPKNEWLCPTCSQRRKK